MRYFFQLGSVNAVAEKGGIVYEKVILATHFPIDNKQGMYFMKMYQERSYVLALAGAAQDCMSLDHIPYI